MTEDVAYDFDVGSSVDLSAGMAVSKSMRADYFGLGISIVAAWTGGFFGGWLSKEGDLQFSSAVYDWTGSL